MKFPILTLINRGVKGSIYGIIPGLVFVPVVYWCRSSGVLVPVQWCIGAGPVVRRCFRVPVCTLTLTYLSTRLTLISQFLTFWHACVYQSGISVVYAVVYVVVVGSRVMGSVHVVVVLGTRVQCPGLCIRYCTTVDTAVSVTVPL